MVSLDLPHPYTLTLQGFGRLYQMATSNIRPARQMLKTYVESYKQQEYRCTHPVLIGGLAIDIDDLASKQGYFDRSNDCCAFAFEIGNRNLPLYHSIINISLNRLLVNVEMLSTSNNRALSIRETQLLLVETYFLYFLNHVLSLENSSAYPSVANRHDTPIFIRLCSLSHAS